MNLVPALKLSSIERLNAARDALMVEHQTFARNLNDVKHQLPINLRNQMGREQVYQQIIRIQYDCEQNKLTNLKKKSAQTKSLDDFHLFEQQLATLTASVERMEQEDSDSRLRYKALEKCAALHERMLNVIENLVGILMDFSYAENRSTICICISQHNPVVLADYLQNASGSTTPICDFSGSDATTSIFKQIEEANSETSIGIDADVNAMNAQKKMDTSANVRFSGTESTKTSNEVRMKLAFIESNQIKSNVHNSG